MNKIKTQMLASIHEMFPETVTSEIVTRTELVAVEKSNVDYKHYWFTGDAISRGIYKLPSVKIKMPKKETKIELYKPIDNTQSLIPEVDINYVPFGIYSDVEHVIKSEMFYPVYIYGASGNGKSTSIEQVCAKLKRPIIRINLNNQTDEDMLIGSKTLVDGNVEIVEGPVLRAMRIGVILVCEELDAANANAILCLQGIMEGNGFYFKLKNEIIMPTKGFNIFATANTKGKGSSDGRYLGTNLLNEAFLERFAVTLVQDFPKASVELKIISNLMEQHNCMDAEFAKDLVKWSDIVRKTFQEGIIDENISTRRLIHIIKAYAIFNNKKKAVELCLNRFDDITRMAFLDLYDKIQNDEVIIEEEIVNE